MIVNADCLDHLRKQPDASFSAVVTDPPYALEFMGKGWDKVLPSVDIWRECLRVLKPGGMLLAFGGTRTYHRLTCAIEDAGFEIRDCLMWLYGQGFPKSLAIDKAIDKADGAERKKTGRILSVTGNRKSRSNALAQSGLGAVNVGPQAHEETLPASSRSAPWAGYGTALKPAWEPIVVAMKPTDGTFAQNALTHGVAGINVDAARVGDNPGYSYPNGPGGNTFSVGKKVDGTRTKPVESTKGRWPANVALDEEAQERLGDSSRFFYCAKASKRDRGEGNTHPTVKPVELMRWLVRLVKMPADTRVLDPFAGSGTTGVACTLEGVEFVGVERDPEYCEIARSRIPARRSIGDA